MKWIIILTTLLPLSITAQEVAVPSSTYILPTAYPSETGVRQIGLLSDSYAALSDMATIYAHPLMFWLAPSVEVDLHWIRPTQQAATTSALASYHRVSVPSPLMMIFQMEGDLGMITPEGSIGFLLGVTNGLRYSVKLDQGMLTCSAGLEIGFGSPDERTTVELPIIYPRMVAFYDGWIAEFGATYEYNLSEHWTVAALTNVFANTDKSFVEITPRITWHISDHVSLHLDPVITYGTYPYGTDWQLVILPDLTYRF